MIFGKNTTLFRIVFFLNIFFIVAQTSRVENVLKHDWLFSEVDNKDAYLENFNDTNWRLLSLPHDWSIEGDYDKDNLSGGLCGYLPSGIIWYRKNLEIFKEDIGKKTTLTFDSVFMNSTIWINGKELGKHPYGYNTFAFDISNFLKAGKNVLAIRLDNSEQPSSRWYTGTGIFGNVKLITTNKQYIKRQGVFFRTLSCDANLAKLAVDIDVVSEKDNEIELTLIDENDKECINVSSEIKKNKGYKEFTINSPKLWSTDVPNLYTLRVRLKNQDKILDETSHQVGIRSLFFDSQKGFFLNGKHTKMKGVCEHHDGGPLGGAFPEKLLKERLELLKGMGCNAIRTAHNPRPQQFYKLCNEIGIMVMDEIFDGWHKKATADYGGRFFDDWWKKDVTEWVKSNRNNPSIVMYSVGNETGKKDIYNISDHIKKYDTTRPTTGGTVFEGVDIQGYNGPGGVPGSMQEFHEKYPDELCVRTEVPHTLQTRGFYRVKTWWRQRNLERNEIPEYGEKQIFFDGHPRFSSSYDNAGVRISARTSWRETRDMPWIIGEFRWTGFDYLGEASFSGGEWPARIWNFGVIDLAGIPKDHYYFYKSQWTKEPMVHILPHWTHRFLKKGTKVPVVVYSNCEEVELFLNGKSLGKKKEDPEWLEFLWKVPYEKGTLQAIGYNKGIATVEKEWKTAGAPSALKLTSNNIKLIADKIDTATISFSSEDSDGNFVPWCMNKVNFAFDGQLVKHLGFENGNPIDVTNHRKNFRNLFYGKAKGFFQSTNKQGAVEITAATIFGDTLFQTKEQITLDFKRVPLRGELSEALFQIKYTTDGSNPINGKQYNSHFFINKTTLVKAVLLKNNKPLIEFEQLFTKGIKPKITDPRWNNKNIKKQDDLAFNGPFDKELLGKWKKGSDVYEFKKNGKLYIEHLYGSSPKAYWWYDYPNDIFEADGDAGSGQLIWIKDKKKLKIKLDTQKSIKLIVTNPDGSTDIFKKVKA